MAPVAGQFMKVTFSGTMYLPQQSWSFSIWLRGTTPFAAGGAATVANGVGDTYYTGQLKTTLLSMMVPQCSLTRITYRTYQPNSETLFDEAYKTYTDVGTGTGANAAQVAVVATLQTAGFGRAYRGRIYLPASGCVTGTGSTTITPSATSICTAIKNYLNQWRAVGANIPCLISSSRGQSSDLTAVRVGQVFDTQRRRRDKLGEGTPSVQALT